MTIYDFKAKFESKGYKDKLLFKANLISTAQSFSSLYGADLTFAAAGRAYALPAGLLCGRITLFGIQFSQIPLF